MKSRINTCVAALVVTMACVLPAWSQQLMGLVIQRNDQGVEEPLPGANVRWEGTSTGTITRENGIFLIDRVAGSDRLIISYIGFKSDTILITNQTSLKVELQNLALEEVVIQGWKPTTGLDHTRGVNTVVMLEKELFKAACCNLSESFETNPSVDVSFTDAITGTRQIQMLGLSGPNTMISIENMPGVRGLASSQGIQFIPGTWINSIEVTKGVGPVVNGYESIAGQINVEMKKPQESEKVYANAYVNQSGRTEANVNLTMMAGEKWATTFLLHGSARPFEMDQNADGFLDFPTGNQLNAINRWVFNSGTGWLGQFGIKILRDQKTGGQQGYDPREDKFIGSKYGLEIATNRTELWGKLGYQFADQPYKSIGLQLSASNHDHDSYYGYTVHDAKQRSGYANLIYQSIIGSTDHKFKTGLSFLFDDYDESLSTPLGIRFDRDGTSETKNVAVFDRVERVPGAFFEYTYEYSHQIAVIAGLRVDRHNLFGTIVTPRIHTRFDLTPTSSLRLSAGKGTRVANLFMENTGVLASSRTIVLSRFNSDHAYGFKPDQAWNFGANFSQDFTLDYRSGTITVDYFYTNFKNQVIVDLDQSAREANFYSLGGKSYSHSFQFQTDYEVIRRLDLRLAYRYLDVKADYASLGLMQRPLIPSHRAFMNLAYETRNSWKFDYTLQWLGKQRIPDTSVNPQGYQLPAYADDYVLMNAQVTKDLKDKWSLYVGVENIGNYTLKNPIVSASEPFSGYFDSSMVWGPVFGRMAYMGVRYKVR